MTEIIEREIADMCGCPDVNAQTNRDTYLFMQMSRPRTNANPPIPSQDSGVNGAPECVE